MAYEGVIVDGCNPSRWDAPGVFDHLREGGVTAANATIAIWEGFADTVDRLSVWHRRFREQADDLALVKTAADLRRARADGRTGIVLGWQNLSPIEDDIERLEVFHALGVRIVQLSYNIRNLAANGCYELADDGLSLFGVKAVRKLNELGMLIDLSHVGDRSSRHAIEVSDQPVAFTHTNLREFCDMPRNKPAALIEALVAKGGVVGANAFPAFLPRGYDATLGDYVDGIERLIEMAGIDHVGIATDFCEGHDAAFWDYLGRLHGKTPHFDLRVDDPSPAIDGLRDSTQMRRIAEALSERGYADDEVAKVMGENWLRLYETVWRG